MRTSLTAALVSTRLVQIRLEAKNRVEQKCRSIWENKQEASSVIILYQNILLQMEMEMEKPMSVLGADNQIHILTLTS